MNIKRFFNDIYFDVTGIIFIFLFVFYLWDGSIHQQVGVILAGVSFILWIISRLQLGTSFSMLPKASRLVTNGIYSKTRHPMYIFSSLCLLGLFVAINSYYLYLLFVALVILQTVRVRKENSILHYKFGEEYEKYHKDTWF